MLPTTSRWHRGSRPVRCLHPKHQPQLNTSLIVANFRDVGETINTLGSRIILRERTLFRGGSIRDVDDLSLIATPRTIVNLRKGSDPSHEGVRGLHCPAPDSVEVYDVAMGFNRKWILSVLKALADDLSMPPFYVHCAAGKDRTGIIIAAILSAVGVERELIFDDYNLSSGALQPKRFAQALDCFAEPNYFRRVDLSVFGSCFSTHRASRLIESAD